MNFFKRPKTSIIIPVYNTEEYLPACLDSVLAQTQREIEVILVDDGSTDGSLAIERAYAQRDSRVRIIQQSNLRQGTARNRGLAEARGEFIYFMDSDDLIMPELLETCYEACENDELDFVIFDTAGFTDDPSIDCSDQFPEIRDRSCAVTTDIVDAPTFWASTFRKGYLIPICWLEYFRRSFLLDNDLRFAERIFFEDNDWFVRVFMAAKRIRYLPKKLHRYRERPGSNVHSGFSPLLADSCFDVHEILHGLMRSNLGNPTRARMILDMSYCKDARFREFSVLEPTSELISRIHAFSDTVTARLKEEDEDDALKTLDFHALASLADGTASWTQEPLVSLSEEFVAQALFSKLPSEDEAHRLGVYGVGKACAIFVNHFDFGARELFFLESSCESGRTAFGKPVYSIDEAADLDLDAVVITSTKYAEGMKAAVTSHLGEEMPVYVLPRAILFAFNTHSLR